MERLKLFEAVRKKGALEKEVFPGHPNKLRALLDRLVRKDPAERIALDELLDALLREELQLLNASPEPQLARVLARTEGQACWKEKSLVLVSGKLLVFDPLRPAKAESLFDLESFVISRAVVTGALSRPEDSAQTAHAAPADEGLAAVELRSQHLLGVALMHSEQQMTELLFETLLQAQRNNNTAQNGSGMS